MRKNLFMVAAVALMALISCNKEELRNYTDGVVFTAEFEQDAYTKTTLGDMGEKGRKAKWNAGDKIKINGVEFTAVSDGYESKFELVDANAEFKESESYFAIYPSVTTGNSTGVKIPNEQDGTFASASIAVAMSSDNSLVFKNIPAILKFQVPVECNIVEITSASSLAGTPDIKFTDGSITVGPAISQGSKTITISNEFVPGEDYYVAVAPISTFKHKLSVSIDGKLSKTSEQDVTFVRSNIHNLGVLPKAKLSRNLAFSANSAIVLTDNTWSKAKPTLSGEMTGVKYTSSNPEVATVNETTGDVTVISAGKTTITASAEANDTYHSDSASYELTVEVPLTDWNLVGAIGTINMTKSETYTDLYVAKNVALSSAKSFRFVNKDKSKTVGAYGTSGTVDCKGQINSWYDSNATSEYAANISISTNANYDIYFSPTDLNFLIIKTGVETYNSQWEIVGWIANKDSWGGGSGYFLQGNYVNPALPLQITMDLTSGDYFKILKNKNWTAGNNGGWIGAPGNDGATKDYTLAVNGSTSVGTYHSYDNHKAQFHMKNNGTYKIEVTVGNVYASATVKLTRIK